MAPRPPSICRECRCLVPEGGPYCKAHVNDNMQTRAAKAREAIRRSSGLKSLYDSHQWRKVTQPFIIRRDPICMIGFLCEGRAWSAQVDHIVKAEIYIAQHGGDTRYFYDETNLQGVCAEDHTRKTSLEMRGLWPVLPGLGNDGK